MEQLTLTRPDDWHLHLRDGAVLAAVLPHTVERFARAIVMPNLNPPATDADSVRAYRERITAALPDAGAFEPLMTLYLTDATTPRDIEQAARGAGVTAVKLYPAGATTHSTAGVTDLEGLDQTFEAMTEHGLPLLIHGEVVDPGVDIFDREAVFIDRHLAPLVERHPRLKVVLEHVSTRAGVAFVREAGPNVGATLTAHHLQLNRDALFDGGLRPHHFCRPILKRERDREALIEAATGGEPKFFLGTDSAPHPRGAKESACGCAGIYTAHAALELYAEVFEAAGALDRLEAFASHHGPDFYGLPRNDERITLLREPWTVPAEYPLGNERVVPLRAGETVGWKVESNGNHAS